MAKIELLLGGPTTAEREDQIEELIYDLNINIESAVIVRVKALITWLSKINTNNQSYLDLVATVAIGQPVKLPRVSFGVYEHRGYVMPKMIINSFYMQDFDTGNKHFISNKVIDEIGLDIESTFEFEYCGFKRVGAIAANKSDVIYHLGNRPHIYSSGEFLAVKTKSQ